MESSEDKQWASKYLLDPLNAPEPSDETGPGTHFDSTFAPAATTTSSKKQPQATVEEVGAYPTPPASVSPRHSRFSSVTEGQSRQYGRQSPRESTEIPTSSTRTSLEGTRPRRSSSLAERYAGDQSHHPLDIIRKQSLRAHRSPHLRKDHHHGVDTIDKLDNVNDAFHHEGPYDAVSLARNRSSRAAPVAALMGSNTEALKATPKAYIADSLRHHRPIDGVAQIPAGVPDRLTGQVLDYQEGTDMQRDNEKNFLNHWQGVTYLPEDRKGKGEPSYSIEKALKEGKHGRHSSETGIEMKPRARRPSDLSSSGRARASSGTGMATGNEQSYAEWESGLRRSSSARGPRLVSKIGSLTRRHRQGNKDVSEH